MNLTTDRGRKAQDAVLDLTWGNDNSQASPETLADLHALTRVVDLAIYSQVQVLRNRGLSWQVVGDALGITRQAAQQRYGR